VPSVILATSIAHQPLPINAHPADAIKPDEPGGFVNILAVDLDAHLKKYPRKTVRETIDTNAFNWR
jgi:hypothetical protein